MNWPKLPSFERVNLGTTSSTYSLLPLTSSPASLSPNPSEISDKHEPSQEEDIGINLGGSIGREINGREKGNQLMTHALLVLTTILLLFFFMILSNGGISSGVGVNNKGNRRNVNLVTHPPKYLVRDYSVWLGFNNMRYITESALLYAQLLNRTLILPSFLYARDCQPGMDCSQFWPERDISATGYDGDNRWIIPIESFLNLDAIGRKYDGSIITVPNYFEQYSINSSVIENKKGEWEQDTYGTAALNYSSVDNSLLLDRSVILVDTIDPTIPIPAEGHSPIPIPSYLSTHLQEYVLAALQDQFGTYRYKDFKMNPPILLKNLVQDLPSGLRRDIRAVVQASVEAGEASPGVMQGEGVLGFVDGLDAEIEVVKRWLEVLFHEPGCEWMLLRTYESFHEGFLAKATHRIEYSIAYKHHLRGLVEEYGPVGSDVLHFKGELHDLIKPGSLRFTSAVAQAKFKKIVLNDLKPDPKVGEFAQELDRRMRVRCGGRQWMGSHFRRGDFPDGWRVSSRPSDHMARIKSELEKGLNLMRSIRVSQSAGNIVPGAPVFDEAASELPEPLDPFYVSTDEKDLDILAALQAAGGLLLSDLMTEEDRKQLGNNALLTDWLGLVEQALLARSVYFFGSKMSSFTGGVINQRVELEKGWKTVSVG